MQIITRLPMMVPAAMKMGFATGGAGSHPWVSPMAATTTAAVATVAAEINPRRPSRAPLTATADTSDTAADVTTPPNTNSAVIVAARMDPQNNRGPHRLSPRLPAIAARAAASRTTASKALLSRGAPRQ
jgi:hypothetical protein